MKNQEIGLVTRAAWNGDGESMCLRIVFFVRYRTRIGISSGLVGLAYPDLTSVFAGTNASQDDFPGNSVTYAPFPFRAVETGQLKDPCTLSPYWIMCIPK